MPQLIGKKYKVILYIIFLAILSTTSRKSLEKKINNSSIINKINVVGLSNIENLKIKNELASISHQNIFVLEKKEISMIIKKYNIIEEYRIKKIYPSRLEVDIKPTKFIAKVTKVGNKLMVGANGKLISSELNDKMLPYIFGKFNTKYFLEFKKTVELSKFNFSEFKMVYFFPSNRWDILTIDNTLIKLPKNNMSQSLNLAHKIISSKKFKNQNIIDLRVNSHVIIK